MAAFPPPAEGEFITIAEAADRLSVSTKSVRRYIASGQLEAVRIGPRLLRVPVSSLAQLGTAVSWASRR